MPRETSCCDPAHIDELLQGRLTLAEQSQLEKHLDNCPACRDRVEAQAAEHVYWEEAAVHLRDDDLDEELRTSIWAASAGSEELAASVSLHTLRIVDYFDPTDDPKMLGRFGGYEIVGIVGYGGMGVVLKGFEAALDRYVAIKLLAPHLASSGAARARFAREARAAAAVLHENVVAIHGVSEAKALPFLVMPYMNGDSLQKRLDQKGPMQIGEILRIGMQIAAGLAAAHAQGLVHRDIKPGNILLDKGVERVTITDFRPGAGRRRRQPDATPAPLPERRNICPPSRPVAKRWMAEATFSAWAACCTQCAPADRPFEPKPPLGSCTAFRSLRRRRFATSRRRHPCGCARSSQNSMPRTRRALPDLRARLPTCLAAGSRTYSNRPSFRLPPRGGNRRLRKTDLRLSCQPWPLGSPSFPWLGSRS